MSIIWNTTFTYQEYKAYVQTHKDCGIGGRTPYSMIGNDSGTDNEEILANTVITVPSSNTEYELTAEYADDFSEGVPFIKVTINHGEEKKEYNINIDEINTHNASAIEIFALFSYADSHEKNMGFAASLWTTLTGYVKNNPAYARMNQVEQKLDWTEMVEEIRDEYMGSGLYKQVSDGNKLISLLEQYGMPETVEMNYMDAEHWLPASNFVCQLFTDIEAAFIEIDGNGALSYINMQDETSNWSMKITQEQLAKALELKSLESATAITEFYLYISDKSFWESYLNSDMSLDDLRGIAAKTCEASTYTDEEGNLLYLSEFAKRYFLSYINNETFYARRFGARNFNIQKLKDSEKLFYQKFR